MFLAILPPLHAAAQTPDDHAPMTREEFDTLFTRLDNAGRWGELDQKGTLNLITPEVRLRAVGEVRDGGIVSLARELEAGPMPLFDNMDLEELALEAAARSRYSFLFVASPLRIGGATGSPLNPLAVF